MDSTSLAARLFHRLRPLRCCIVALVSAAMLPSGVAAQATTSCRDGARRDLVVLFVNGVANSQSDAMESCRALAGRLSDWQLGTLPVELFYNRTATGEIECYADLPAPNCHIQLDDVVEAAAQMHNVAENFPRASQVDAVRLGRAIAAHLAGGRRVIVVAHSQGNLMFQEAVFGRQSPITPTDRLSVGWLSVAAPFLEVMPSVGGFDAVIFENDLLRAGQQLLVLLDLVQRHVILGRAESNSRVLRNLAPSVLTGELGEWGRYHAFATYLSHAASAARMRSALHQMVNGFTPATPVAPVAPGPEPLGATPTRLLLVLDISASMRDNGKLEAAKREARRVVTQLGPSAIVAVATFGGSCRASLLSRGGGGHAEALAAIEALTANGNTPLGAAMSQAADVVEASGSPADYHVVIVTDGLDTCGGDWRGAAARLGAALNLRVVP
jgi:hypothetical protein